MLPEAHHHSLVRVSPAKLRPTQITVGYAEVRTKRREWTAMGRHERHEALRHQVFPSVLGPREHLYIVDHHHLGLALLEEGVTEVWAAVLADFSWLDPAVFWRSMEFRSWIHPYDAHGRRRECRELPQHLSQMQDDPFRSLAGLVHRAGGYAKSMEPFAEFLWADYFRARVRRAQIRRAPARAVREGVRLARSPDARYLPGWSGRHTR